MYIIWGSIEICRNKGKTCVYNSQINKQLCIGQQFAIIEYFWYFIVCSIKWYKFAIRKWNFVIILQHLVKIPERFIKSTFIYLFCIIVRESMAVLCYAIEWSNIDIAYEKSINHKTFSTGKVPFFCCCFHLKSHELMP